MNDFEAAWWAAFAILTGLGVVSLIVVELIRPGKKLEAMGPQQPTDTDKDANAKN